MKRKLLNELRYFRHRKRHILLNALLDWKGNVQDKGSDINGMRKSKHGQKRGL